MKKVLLISVIIVVAVFCVKTLLLNRFSKELLCSQTKKHQGLTLRIKALRYDGYNKAFIDGFEVLDKEGKDTVIHVSRVVTKIDPFKVHQGLRAFIDIKATGGNISLKKLKKLTYDLCNWEKNKNARISWIYGTEGNAPDQAQRTISFEDFRIKDGKAKRQFIAAPFDIKGLSGTLKTDGLKAFLENVRGDIKIGDVKMAGLISLPFGDVEKKISIKREKIDLARLGDNKANQHLPKEMCESLTFIAFLLGGKPVVKAN